jgi:hypothetical protein
MLLSHLDKLPEGFSNENVGLRFNNGNLPYTEQIRAVKPDPTEDNTDYVKDQGCFYAGSMVHTVNEAGVDVGSTSAGILVERGFMRRLTVSYHCWEPVIKENPSCFGSSNAAFCKVMQGPGQAPASVEFRNEFMEMQVV